MEDLVAGYGIDIRLERNDRFGLSLGQPESGQRRQFQNRHGQMFQIVAADVDDAHPRELPDLRRQPLQLILPQREHRQLVARTDLGRQLLQEVLVQHQRVQLPQQPDGCRKLGHSILTRLQINHQKKNQTFNNNKYVIYI